MNLLARTRDLIANNLAELIDRAEEPAAMIRTVIREMEETLAEVRASAARTIADTRELNRHARNLEALQDDWSDKAALALSKGREDLARAALVEKRKAGDLAAQLAAEAAVLDESLRAYEQDIDKLQIRLREVRSRQTAIAVRLESAHNRIKLRSLLAAERVDEAMARFDQLERHADRAEGHAETLGLGGGSARAGLAGEIGALDDPVEAELEALRRALPQSPASREG